MRCVYGILLALLLTSTVASKKAAAHSYTPTVLADKPLPDEHIETEYGDIELPNGVDMAENDEKYVGNEKRGPGSRDVKEGKVGGDGGVSVGGVKIEQNRGSPIKNSKPKTEDDAKTNKVLGNAGPDSNKGQPKAFKVDEEEVAQAAMIDNLFEDIQTGIDQQGKNLPSSVDGDKNDESVIASYAPANNESHQSASHSTINKDIEDEAKKAPAEQERIKIEGAEKLKSDEKIKREVEEAKQKEENERRIREDAENQRLADEERLKKEVEADRLKKELELKKQEEAAENEKRLREEQEAQAKKELEAKQEEEAKRERKLAQEQEAKKKEEERLHKEAELKVKQKNAQKGKKIREKVEAKKKLEEEQRLRKEAENKIKSDEEMLAKIAGAERLQKEQQEQLEKEAVAEAYRLQEVEAQETEAAKTESLIREDTPFSQVPIDSEQVNLYQQTSLEINLEELEDDENAGLPVPKDPHGGRGYPTIHDLQKHPWINLNCFTPYSETFTTKLCDALYSIFMTFIATDKMIFAIIALMFTLKLFAVAVSIFASLIGDDLISADRAKRFLGIIDGDLSQGAQYLAQMKKSGGDGHADSEFGDGGLTSESTARLIKSIGEISEHLKSMVPAKSKNN